MNLNTLQEFRHGVYASLSRAADALFNPVDALLTESTASSFAELSLSPCFARRWASLYEAFEDGRIEGERLRQVLIAQLPRPATGERLRLGIDATGIARQEARTSADRTALLVHNLPHSRTPPITAGWQFSTLMVLPDPVSSWGYLLDSRRIESQQTALEVAAAQLRACVALLPEGLRPRLAADRASPSAAFVRATADISCGKLLRIACRRVFSRPAPPPTGKRGAPRKDGERFACHDQSTHGAPSARLRRRRACWSAHRGGRLGALALSPCTRSGTDRDPRDALWRQRQEAGPAGQLVGVDRPGACAPGPDQPTVPPPLWDGTDFPLSQAGGVVGGAAPAHPRAV